jgi:hypothetical protein
MLNRKMGVTKLQFFGKTFIIPISTLSETLEITILPLTVRPHKLPFNSFVRIRLINVVAQHFSKGLRKAFDVDKSGKVFRDFSFGHIL